VQYARAFFAFWYDFVIGDDWRIAAGVLITLLLAAGAANAISRPLGTTVLIAGVLLTIGYALSRSVRGKA
jgi:hypothetical protein